MIKTMVVFLVALSTTAQAVEIKLEPYRKTIGMHARVNGKDGFFAFDTGSGLTQITPQFAEKIGCKPWGRIVGFTMTGKRLDTARCDDATFEIGGEKFKPAVASVFNVMEMFPEGAEPIDGLIGLDVFEGRTITIDFPAMRLFVETPSSARKRTRNATEIPARIGREAQGRALAVSVAVPTSRGTIWMELDSGNGGTILVAKPYADLFGLDPAKNDPQPVDYPFGRFRITGAAFAAGITLDGNLGMPFLKDRVVTFDLKSGRVWIK
jgi:predicted aspartyl protease